jgi:hypothetical protein
MAPSARGSAGSVRQPLQETRMLATRNDCCGLALKSEAPIQRQRRRSQLFCRADKRGRDDEHVLAVEPHPRANKALMPAFLFSLSHRLIPVTILSFKRGFGATAKCKPQNNRARVLHIGSPQKYPVSLSCGPFASQSMQNIRYPLCSLYYIHSIMVLL